MSRLALWSSTSRQIGNVAVTSTRWNRSADFDDSIVEGFRTNYLLG